MAVSATNLATAYDNVDRTDYTTASITPAAQSLVLAWVVTRKASAAVTPTLSGNGLTWVQVATVTGGGIDAIRVTLFRAMGTSPSAGAVTITGDGTTQIGCAWSIVQYTGVDTSGTNGSGAIVQFDTETLSGASGGGTSTLAAFSSTLNATAGGVGINLNTAITAGSGFAQSGTAIGASPNNGIHSEFLASNDTTVDWTWTGSATGGAISVELKAAIGFDAASNGGAGATGNDSWTHTPVGTPKGALVYIVGDQITDEITGVTYGGVAMTEVALSPVTLNSSEKAIVHGYFLGSSVPTGAQTVAYTTSGSTVTHSACAITFTATGDTAVEDTSTISSASATNPSVTMTIDEDSIISIAFMSGDAAVTGITPLTGWTSRFEDDLGGQVNGFYTKDTNVSVDTAAGYTAASDESCLLGVAIKEVTVVTTYDVSVSDSITVTESVGRLLESNRSVSDSVTVTESVKVELNSQVNKSESITITESLKAELNSFINKSENITVTEAITVYIPEYLLSTSDSISVTESVNRLLESYVNKSESITITESVGRVLESQVSTSDSVTVTENTKVELESLINKSESVTITESVSVYVPTYLLAVSDSITVTDTPSVSIESTAELTISKSESITVSELTNQLLESYVNKSDSISVTDTPTVLRIEPDLAIARTPENYQDGKGVRIV